MRFGTECQNGGNSRNGLKRFKHRHGGAGFETLEGRRMLTAVNPVISEIMAGNKTGIKDSFGVNADWLEIANPDPRQTVNLTGWKLQYKNTTWNFPAMSLGPNEFRVIFADSLNL